MDFLVLSSLTNHSINLRWLIVKKKDFSLTELEDKFTYFTSNMPNETYRN